MPNYRRVREGHMYFFTVVTYQRQPILCRDECVNALSAVVSEVRSRYPFTTVAGVLLPEHLHSIWELPEGDSDYSIRWALIKKEFTKRIGGVVGTAHPATGVVGATTMGAVGIAHPTVDLVGAAHPTRSRQRHREGTVWQRRFWEHQIRDEADLTAHCDYIHYNPVRHGLVSAPKDWPHSTFHRFVAEGIYPPDWGASPIEFPDNVGNE